MSGHDVGLTVDGGNIEQKVVPVALAPEATYSDSFDTVITLSGVQDEITVCADADNDVDELNEDNNCLSNFLSTVCRDLPAWVMAGQ